MEKIGLPRVSENKISANHSDFVIEPLYPGYGPTIGNALRRVLLGSIIGSAATYFRVEGLNHEFSAIHGVKEDMIELLLNIKSINFRSFSDEPVAIELSKKGASEVRAADFKPNSQIEIANPDQHLASLDKDADFQLEVIVERDRGFRPSTAGVKKEIGWITIDASFSPVKRVNLVVEDTRVGQMTNFNKLNLGLTTDGTITPAEALKEASRVLVDHFEAIISDSTFNPGLTEKLEENTPTEPEFDNGENASENRVKIEEAGFSSRTTNALINTGIRSIAGLKRLTPLKIEEIKGLGKKGIAEVREILNNYE